MNNNISTNAMEDKMSSENQELMDNMAPKLFGVINALDNIEAQDIWMNNVSDMVNHYLKVVLKE